MKIQRYQISARLDVTENHKAEAVVTWYHEEKGQFVFYKDVAHLIEKADKDDAKEKEWKPIDTMPRGEFVEVLWFDEYAQGYGIVEAMKDHWFPREEITNRTGRIIRPTHWRRIVR